MGWGEIIKQHVLAMDAIGRSAQAVRRVNECDILDASSLDRIFYFLMNDHGVDAFCETKQEQAVRLVHHQVQGLDAGIDHP